MPQSNPYSPVTTSPHLRVVRDEGSAFYDGEPVPHQKVNQRSELFTMLTNGIVESIGPACGPSAGWLYVVLAKHADWRTGKCCPSLSTIAGESGMSVRQAIRCIDALEKSGFITKQKRYGRDGDYTSNEYTILNRTVSLGSDRGSDRGSDIPYDTGSDTPYDKTDTLTRDNNTERDTTNSLGTNEKSWLKESFNQFFDAYPADRRLKVAEAKREWVQIHPDTDKLSDLLASLERWKKSESWVSGFAPGIEKFLATRMWEGRPPGAPPLGTGGLL